MFGVTPRELREALGCGRLGITLAFLAQALLAMQDASIKVLVLTVPVWQVLFIRSAIIVVGCIGYGGLPLLRHAASTRMALQLITRGLVTLTAWICYFAAARELPFAELVTLYFSAPLFVILLAAVLLGEHVTWDRWAAVGLGFAGTLAATRTVEFSLAPAVLLVMAAAILWAYGVILTRRI